MMILITYYVNTQTTQGIKRLSKVAKICKNYGQRVQNSVFECLVDATQFVMLKKQLSDVIDQEKDSVRYYTLGEQYKNKVEHVGKENGIDMSGTLIC